MFKKKRRVLLLGLYTMSENQKVGQDHLDELANMDHGLVHRPKNLTRRSSIQKIIHMCHQSCHVFLWVQDFHMSLLADLRKIIPVLRSMLALRLGVYLIFGLLAAELAYCLFATLTLLMPSGSAFFLFCVGVLCLLAFQVFDVALELRKKLRGSFSVTKKKLN